MNGYVTALSMDTGKCLDIEVLSEVYAMENQQDTRKESMASTVEHVGKCKANYTGSAPSIETEGRGKVNIPTQ